MKSFPETFAHNLKSKITHPFIYTRVEISFFFCFLEVGHYFEETSLRLEFGMTPLTHSLTHSFISASGATRTPSVREEEKEKQRENIKIE
jgi:hypothetical protein